MNFNIAGDEVSNKPLHAQPLCCGCSEITVADSLNASTNEIPFRARHVQLATASFALYQAVMPPTTFEMFRKPSCSRRLDAMEER